MNVLVVFDVLDHSKHVLVLFVRPFLSFVPIQGPTMTTNAAPNATSKTQAMLPASSAIGDVNDDDESRATAAAWAAGTPRDADLDVDAASNTSVLRIPPSLGQGPTMTTNGELDADASRSFHTLGAAVPPFGAGEPLFKVVRPFEDAVRSFSPPFAVRYIRTAFCCRGTTCFSQPWLGSGIFLLHYRHNVYVHIPLPSLFVIIS